MSDDLPLFNPSCMGQPMGKASISAQSPAYLSDIQVGLPAGIVSWHHESLSRSHFSHHVLSGPCCLYGAHGCVLPKLNIITSFPIVSCYLCLGFVSCFVCTVVSLFVSCNDCKKHGRCGLTPFLSIEMKPKSMKPPPFCQIWSQSLHTKDFLQLSGARFHLTVENIYSFDRHASFSQYQGLASHRMSSLTVQMFQLIN